MTRNKQAKTAARDLAARTGKPYAAARRQTASRSNGAGNGPVILAADLRKELINAFRGAGWPVEADPSYEFGKYQLYAGPMAITVGRADQLDSFSGPEDPDDEAFVDVTVPPTIGLTAPLDVVQDEPSAQLEGTLAAADVVRRASELLAGGRADAIRRKRADTDCPICGDRYPAEHLLSPADHGLAVCPACVFDGDLFYGGRFPNLAFDLDRLLDGDLAAPAGWSAVVALLACGARPGLSERLTAIWDENEVLHAPAPHWSDPGSIWIWLPHGTRPTCLERFGPGARLGVIVDAIDAAYPDLRGRVRAELLESAREAGVFEDDDEGSGIPDGFLAAVWPAVIAYTLAFTTQANERPMHRPPLQHVVNSFDCLRDHWDQIGSDLDLLDVESTMPDGIGIMSDALRA
jgi:hypothetical protein